MECEDEPVKIAHGVTRSVLLVGPYALKFPSVRYGWNKFLRGLLSNMCERQFKPLAAKYRLAPVVFGVPGGWLTVQRRCEPLTAEQWSDLLFLYDEGPPVGVDWHGFSCDFKRDNFGTIDGSVVLLDYGELT
jgi:hypothetical protein